MSTIDRLNEIYSEFKEGLKLSDTLSIYAECEANFRNTLLELPQVGRDIEIDFDFFKK